MDIVYIYETFLNYTKCIYSYNKLKSFSNIFYKLFIYICVYILFIYIVSYNGITNIMYKTNTIIEALLYFYKCYLYISRKIR